MAVAQWQSSKTRTPDCQVTVPRQQGKIAQQSLGAFRLARVTHQKDLVLHKHKFCPQNFKNRQTPREWRPLSCPNSYQTKLFETISIAHPARAIGASQTVRTGIGKDIGRLAKMIAPFSLS